MWKPCVNSFKIRENRKNSSFNNILSRFTSPQINTLFSPIVPLLLSGGSFVPPAHLVMSADVFGCYDWVGIQASSSGSLAGMPLITRQSTLHPEPHRMTHPHVSTASVDKPCATGPGRGAGISGAERDARAFRKDHLLPRWYAASTADTHLGNRVN